MKSTFLLLSLGLATLGLAAPQQLDPSCPACEAPTCPQEVCAKCLCEHAAKVKCYEENTANGFECPYPLPAVCDCPADAAISSTISVSTSPASTSPTSTPPSAVRRDEEVEDDQSSEGSDVCECEDTVCIQSWPESCYCANDNKKKCYEKCGGVPPAYQSCPPQVSTLASSEPAAFLDSFTLPTATPPPSRIVKKQEQVESEATPTPIEELSATCSCEPQVCVDQWPQSCHCQNDHAIQCANSCGVPVPPLQSCPPLPSDAPAAGPFDLSEFTTLKRLRRTPTTSAAPADTPIIEYLRCGSRGQSPCPNSMVCVDDPNSTGCGLSCDQGGICVSTEETCGGLMGKICPNNRKCVDDPRDDCDSKNGGADCMGLCV